MASTERLRVSRNRWANGIRSAVHLYQSRRKYRRTFQDGREVRQAHRALRYLDIPNPAKLGYYRGEFREWKHLLRVGE
jgi:hypothetical protein